MKAFILAAGLGTRLKPLTDRMPKALVPIDGIPMLQRQILRMKESGIDDIVVNVHHFADQIEEFLRANGNFGCRIAISDERDLLRETGGAIRHAAPLLAGSPDGLVLVHNVDIITDIDYTLIRPDASAMANLVVSRRDTSRYLLFDEDMKLAGWTNVSTGEVRMPDGTAKPENCSKFAFSGIQIISVGMLPLMESWPEKFSIIDFYLNICAGNTIRGIDVTGRTVWDMGKSADIAKR